MKVYIETDWVDSAFDISDPVFGGADRLVLMLMLGKAPYPSVDP